METVVENNVPDSVAKAAADAEKQIAEMRGRRRKAAAQHSEPAQPPAAEPPQAVEPAPAPVVAEPAAPAPEPAAPIVAPADDVLKRENQELRHQLSIVHGRYGDLKVKTDQKLAEMEARLNELSQHPTTPPQVQATAPAPNGLSEADIKERYGDEHLNIIDWRIQKAIEDAKLRPVAPVSDAQTMQRIKGIEAQISANRFWDEAERLSPGVSATNGDPDKGINAAPGWAEFLDTADEFGRTLRKAAEESVMTGNSAQMAQIHDAFKRMTTPEVPKRNQTQTRIPVAAQIAPTSVAGSTPTAGQQKEVIKASEINAFRQKAGQGQVKYEDADRLMKKYLTAIREHRVIFDEALQMR